MKQTQTQIGWQQITGKPRTLVSLGITDQVVLVNERYANPPWIFSLDWGKITNAPAFELALGNPAVNGYILSSTTAGKRSWIAPSGGGAGGAGVIGEAPVGSINGSNMLFTLIQPFIPTTLIVYLNGLRQRPTIDFIISAATQFTLTSAPLSGDSLLTDYFPS